MQHKTYSMNVSDMSEDEIDEAVADALHAIVAAMDMWQEKKSFHQEVTDALFDIMNHRDLTIFDVLIKRDEKVCEILDAPMKDIPKEDCSKGRSIRRWSGSINSGPRIQTAILSCSMTTHSQRISR